MPWGGGGGGAGVDCHMKVMGLLVRFLEKNPKRYQDLVLWVPKRYMYQLKQTQLDMFTIYICNEVASIA